MIQKIKMKIEMLKWKLNHDLNNPFIYMKRLKEQNYLLRKEIAETPHLIFDMLNKIKNQPEVFQILYFSRIRFRRFYDSQWKVAYISNGEINFAYLTLSDTVTSESLINELENCKSFEDIRALDVRCEIYYD